jgi:hypothetical protein
VTILQRLRQWPWLNLLYSFLAGFGGLFILLGSQPSSPIALGVSDGGLADWFVPAAILLVCLLVPIGCVWYVRGYRKGGSSFMGLDLQNFPRGRHSLETIFPRTAAITSTVVFGLTWYYDQTAYFASDSRRDLFAEHSIQFAGGLVLVFAFLQRTYRCLIRKTALKSGVSNAPVVGLSKSRAGDRELVLADGATRLLNLLVIPDWPSQDVGYRRIALILQMEPDGAEIYVTKDGECYRKRR